MPARTKDGLHGDEKAPCLGHGTLELERRPSSPPSGTRICELSMGRRATQILNLVSSRPLHLGLCSARELWVWLDLEC